MSVESSVTSRLKRRTAAWWTLLIITLAIVAAWPPETGRSLAVKVLNWAVDPDDRLPVLPPQLGYGVGDDPAIVEARDAEVRRYDTAYASGGWTRQRLLLKVVRDPFNPQTERQVLIVVGVIAWFVVWRAAGGLR